VVLRLSIVARDKATRRKLVKVLAGIMTLLLFVVVLCVVFVGCTASTSPDSEANINPASDRMGAMAGIPADDDAVPGGGVVPDPAQFVYTARVTAANAEASGLRVAAHSYLADGGAASSLTSDELYPLYIRTLPNARYYLDPVTILISRVDAVPGGWIGIVFSLSEQKWRKGTSDKDRPDDQDAP
jgi:hypothetical protein